MTPLEIAKRLYTIADDKQAKDIKLLMTTDITVLCDYFLICTANSTTHVKTLADEMIFALKQQGVAMHHTEGKGNNSWVLIDFGCVVAHIFMADARDFYKLDRIWADAKTVDID
jgi:ribosome-associated protein